MSEGTRKELEEIEQQLKGLRRAMDRDEVRDRNIEDRLERLEQLSATIVELLQVILQELQRPQPFPATSGITIQPHQGGQ